MAFGISREEMNTWKDKVSRGEIAFLTHYWTEPRFPGIKTVTKVGCSNLEKLAVWCAANGLNPAYIHKRDSYPHYDLIGSKQRDILYREQLWSQIKKFGI